jgi:hypothetical protein
MAEKKTSTRKLIEQNVSSYHKNLPPEKIAEMGLVELLRWAHPDERSRFAFTAMKEGILAKEDAKEFTKVV